LSAWAVRNDAALPGASSHRDGDGLLGSYDVGLLYPDRGLALTFPFPPDIHFSQKEVMSIESSCDCLTADVIEYQEPGGDNGPAIACYFAPREPSSHSAAVQFVVDVHLIDGRTQSLWINGIVVGDPQYVPAPLAPVPWSGNQ
jgi:hypothetical protein